MSKQPPKHPPAPPARSASKAVPGQPADKALIDEDVLHVPKGVSRGTFLFLVALIVFLLVIWMGGDALFGISGGGGGNPVVVRFELPDEGEVEWRATDLLVTHRAMNAALTIDFFLGMQLGLERGKPEPADLTRLMVLDRIARHSGVEITDADLAGHLRETLDFQRATPEILRAAVRGQGMEQVAFEDTIRMLLRVSRFQQLIGFAGAVPDPATIEKLWHEQNVEFAFEYASLAVADLIEEARGSLPDDAGLEAWFAALDEGQKAEFQTGERRSAELALYRDAETTPGTEIASAYPEQRPEGVEPTPPGELAHQYYDLVFSRRFAKPAEEGADPATPGGFFAFEEVEAQCLAEGPVYFAMRRWLEDLEARSANGEAIDLAAEAQKLGLDHQSLPEPRTRTEYAEGVDGAAGDADLASAVFGPAAEGGFYPSPVPLPHGLAIVRVSASAPPELPPFASIRERVAEKWLEPKAQELAKQRLAALREGFERFEPAPKEGQTPPPKLKKAHHRAPSEAFRAAVVAAGLECKTRDYLNRAGPATADPLAEDEEHRTLFSQAASFGLYELETDEVAEPGTSYDAQKVYLVRLAGKREVPLEKMSPTQYDRLKQDARRRAIAAIGSGLDLDFLRRNFGLWLYEDTAASQERAPDQG